MDLLIRAGRTDHTIIDQFLTPTAAGLLGMTRPPISAVVADSVVAMERPQLARITRDAGVPYLIDPVTPLLQSEQSPGDRWTHLAFGQAEPVLQSQLNGYFLDELVELVIDEQRAAGATHLIPPYFYNAKLDDPWWKANLALLTRTAHYLERSAIGLPVVPVFASALREFAPQPSWARGIDAFMKLTKTLNTEAVALSWSWSNAARSNEAALSLLLGATAHAASIGTVVGWRSGLYGLAMTAAGAGGYETGIGARESLHYVSLAAAHKPRAESTDARSQAYVYLSEFSRSVPRRAAAPLLQDPAIVGSLVCDPDNFCCLGGAESMIHTWREHTVRERARELQQLESMPPSSAWRMHHIEKKAERAQILADNANDVLRAAGIKQSIPSATFQSLACVAGRFRSEAARHVA